MIASWEMRAFYCEFCLVMASISWTEIDVLLFLSSMTSSWMVSSCCACCPWLPNGRCSALKRVREENAAGIKRSLGKTKTERGSQDPVEDETWDAKIPKENGTKIKLMFNSP